jgi:DNA polymerase III subunit gamma/tau
MSYQVLARKWRPKNFSEVRGQEHVVRALTNALTQQRLHHAYLFAGTRGVGKTTIARILAKCLNCEGGVTATPCCQCDACLEIDAGRFIDLIEVDAASRTKVEDTRDLLDNVQYLPAKGRFKVYLIDEVHMLSGHSFNALLKTLEEPPAHVKFLLATTDPQRLPITVLSRCLQFNLKILNPEQLQQQLQHILNQENINFESSALTQLATAAKGSVRDALSLLDQAIAYGQGSILNTDVSNLLGTIESSKLYKLLEAVVSNNAATLLATIAELAELGIDFSSTLDSLLNILHEIAMLQIVPSATPTHDATAITKLAKLLTPEDTQLYYQIALLGKRDLALAPSMRTGFEMTLLRMLAFRLSTEEPEQPTPETNITPPTLAPAPVTSENDILSKLVVTGPTQALLRHCVVTKIDNNFVTLELEANQAPLLNKKQEERLQQAFSDYFKRPMQITVALATANIDSQAKLSKQKFEQKQQIAKEAIAQDAKFNELVNKFDAKIIAESIRFDDTDQ